MPKSRQIITAMVSVAALAAPLCLLNLDDKTGFAPVIALFSGNVFKERPIITGGAFDQFNLNKELFIFCFSLVMLGPFLAFVRWMNGRGPRIARQLFAIASLIILVHPLSILTIFTYDVSRYIYHMGVTPKRLLGLALAFAGYVTIVGIAVRVSGVWTRGLGKGVFSLMILVYPLAVLTVFTWLIFVSIGARGVTWMEVLMLVLALAGYVTIAAFAAWMCGVNLRWPDKRHDLG